MDVGESAVGVGQTRPDHDMFGSDLPAVVVLVDVSLWTGLGSGRLCVGQRLDGRTEVSRLWAAVYLTSEYRNHGTLLLGKI